MKKRFIIYYSQALSLLMQLLVYLFTPGDCGALFLLLQAITASIEPLLDTNLKHFEFNLFDCKTAVDSWRMLTGMITFFFTSIALCCNLLLLSDIKLPVHEINGVAIAIYFVSTMIQAIVYFLSLKNSESD